MRSPHLCSLWAGAILSFHLTAYAAPIGQPVPNVAVVDAEGKRHPLPELRSENEVLVVGFFSPRCPYNIKRWDRIAAIGKEYSGKGVKFVGINCNPKETLAEVSSAAQKAGVPFAIYRDEGKALVAALDAKGTPHMYVFDKEGKLRYAGAFDDNADAAKVKKSYLKDAIESVLAGNEVANPEPKAFIGCSIKD